MGRLDITNYSVYTLKLILKIGSVFLITAITF